VLEIIERSRLLVVLGNPGSGKTSLLKYLALQWANEDRGPLPLFVELQEYVKGRYGLLKHLESECACYHLDAREVDRRLKTGQVALFLDGLDEIFDIAMRASVIDEIIALASRYTRAPVVVTSPVIGYESEKLQIAGFTHATLEDF